MSELVSKDLMDKFHNFLAHTYVTIGQVKGRTLLPLPPTESQQAGKETTSSKEKAHILEGKIIFDTRMEFKFKFRRYNHMDQANQECLEARP
jgi:dynein heavy chain